MKNKLTFLILILTITVGESFGQQLTSKIDFVTFEFSHSKRIPYSSIKINIENRPEECSVQVYSSAKNNDKEWKYSVIDTTYVIESNVFNELVKDVLLLNKIDLNRVFLEGGLDGTTCVISFGTFGNSISYHFWTPDNLTELRGLENFLVICKKMIRIGGLDPKEIL
jgi:hypothetical protein